MTNAIDQLLAVVDAFCLARGVSEARASTLIFNGGGRIKALREGRDIGVLTCETSLLWLSQNWPDAADWPEGVPRPLHPSAPVSLPSAVKQPAHHP